MGSTRDRRQLALMAAPRRCMAVVLAVVISTPLVLRVFESDINSELDTYQLEQSKSHGRLASVTAERKEADDLDKQIREHEAALAGHLPGGATSPTLAGAEQKVENLEDDVAAATKARDRAYEAWQCELYGEGPKCRGATRRRGRGPLAEAKHRQYRNAEGKLQAAQNELDAATQERDNQEAGVQETEGSALAAAQQEAREKLPELRQRREVLTGKLQADADERTKHNAEDEGLLAQIRALMRAGEEDGALWLAHPFVFLLFFIIEILPVSVKILLNIGPPTAYDMEAAFDEELLKDRATIRRVEARRVEEGKSETRVDLEADMRDRERKIGKEANEHVAGEMTSIVELALDEWSEQVRDDLTKRQSARERAQRPRTVHQRR